MKKYNTNNKGVLESNVALLVFLCLLLTPFSSTNAYFHDKESSTSNLFSAGSLDLGLSASGEEDERTLAVSNIGESPFEYAARVVETSDPLSSFCDEINVTLDGSDSDLLSFTTVPHHVLIGSSEEFTMEFSVDDTDANLGGQVCVVEFIFEASQEGYSHGEAFFDTETYALTLLGEDYGTIPDTPTYDGPDVVINEVMWMGSISDNEELLSNDEWIELRNMTNAPIDIGKWEIENLKSGGNAYMIPASHTLPANGFFLISNNPETGSKTLVASIVDQPNGAISFNNDYEDNGVLVLKNATGFIIDQTPVPASGGWAAGEHDTSDLRAWSMERNDDPETGWHTCDPTAMTTVEVALMKSYWKEGGQEFNCGTPGAPNLSSNDPSSVSFVAPMMLMSTSVVQDIPTITEETPPEPAVPEVIPETPEETPKKEEELPSADPEVEEPALEEKAPEVSEQISEDANEEGVSATDEPLKDVEGEMIEPTIE